MDSNPYAPPRAPDPTPEADTPSDQPSAFTFAELFACARTNTVRHWGIVFLLSAAIFFVKHVISQAIGHAFGTHEKVQHLSELMQSRQFDGVLASAGSLAVLVVGTTTGRLFLHSTLEAVLVKLYMAALREEPLRAQLVLRGLMLTLPVFLVAWIAEALLVIGSLLCVIPGVVAFTLLTWASYVAADQELPPLTALSASWRLSRTGGWRLASIPLGAMAVMAAVSFASRLAGFGEEVGVALQLPVTILADLLGNVAYGLVSGRVARSRIAAHAVPAPVMEL